MKKIIMLFGILLSLLASAQTKLEYIKYSDKTFENIREAKTPVDTFSFTGIDSLPQRTNLMVFLLDGDTLNIPQTGENITAYSWFTRIGVTVPTKIFFNEEMNRNQLIQPKIGEAGFAWELILISVWLFVIVAVFQKRIVFGEELKDWHIGSFVVSAALMLFPAMYLDTWILLLYVLITALTLLIWLLLFANVLKSKSVAFHRNLFTTAMIFVHVGINYFFPNTEELLVAGLAGMALGLLTKGFWSWWKDSLSEEVELMFHKRSR